MRVGVERKLFESYSPSPSPSSMHRTLCLSYEWNFRYDSVEVERYSDWRMTTVC